MRRTLAAMVTASAVLLATAPAAQTGKKVFISADMEGISGISASDQLSAAGAEYGRSRKMMADDVNAAIRGARAGGATTILVNDSHGSMRNLRLEDLEAGVSLISHSFKRSGIYPRGGREPAVDAATGARHHRVHAGDDAEGLHADSPAVSLH